MKKFLLFAIAAVLWSCSGDDSASAKRMLPTTVTVTESEDGSVKTNTFGYDEKGRLTSATTSGGNFAVGYDNKGRFNVITTQQGAVTFTYGADNKLSGATGVNGIVSPVVWTSSNTFSFLGISFTTAANGDIVKWNDIQLNTGSGNGPFAKVKGFNPLIVALMDNYALLYALRKELVSINSPDDGTLPAVTTFNDEGFPTSVQITGGDLVTIAYTEQ